MNDVPNLVERLAAALSHTSWRCTLGTTDREVLDRVEAHLGPVPASYREFLARVVALENHTGDVRFLAAQDFADPQSELFRALAEWRHADEESARLDAQTLAVTRAFWTGAVPIVVSTINGDDFLAIDRRTPSAPVIESWGEGGWTETARVCATDFGQFLAGFVAVAETGIGAFECGWRLGRRMLQRLHEQDSGYREPMVPLLFTGDFDAAAPPRRPTRPALRSGR
jgi:hypothetical protein